MNHLIKRNTQAGYHACILEIPQLIESLKRDYGFPKCKLRSPATMSRVVPKTRDNNKALEAAKAARLAKAANAANAAREVRDREGLSTGSSGDGGDGDGDDSGEIDYLDESCHTSVTCDPETAALIPNFPNSDEQLPRAELGRSVTALTAGLNYILMFVSPLELDPEETRNLHENSDSALWYDPTIRARLRRRFGSEDYECFLDQLTTVSDTLKELVAKIEITDVGTVEEEIYRLKFSFDKTWTSLLGKLTTAKDELFKILHQDSLIIHHVEDPGYIKSCKKLQSHAEALYNILHTSLKCVDAAHTHNCSVSAEWSDTPTKGVHTPFLKVLFDRSPEWKQLRWEVEVSEVGPKPETEIAAGVSNQEFITRAVREKKQREWHEDLVQHGKRHAIGIITVAATLASVAPETDCQEKLWRERTPKKLKRKINVFGRKESAVDKTVQVTTP
ncbi:hypothetical protein LA080_000390 [Diaporthe eres]|nr:hypothetical protein LA080_000390 [Diaporthe eres]